MGRQAAGWSFLKALVKNQKQLSVYLKIYKIKKIHYKKR